MRRLKGKVASDLILRLENVCTLALVTGGHSIKPVAPRDAVQGSDATADKCQVEVFLAESADVYAGMIGFWSLSCIIASVEPLIWNLIKKKEYPVCVFDHDAPHCGDEGASTLYGKRIGADV